VKLTPEDFDRIDKKKLATVLRKLHAEKPLTARDEALLERARAEALQQQQPAAAPLKSFAKSWDELAGLLGVTRRAILDWRKDPRYAADCPPDRADGRKEVAAWIALVRKHNLRGAEKLDDEVAEDGDERDIIRPPRLGGSQSDWNKAVLYENYDSKRIDRWTTEGTLLVASELEVPFGALLAALQNKLIQFPDVAARRVKGLREERECADVLRDEVDAILTDINAAEFCAETAVGEILRDLPFDAETERLLQIVSFAGQDHAALLQLVSRVATEVLRRLGSASIARAQKAGEITDEALSHGVTGQVTEEAAEREAMRRQQDSARPEKAQETPATAQKRPVKRRQGRSRKPTIRIPAAVEGAIAPVPKKKKRRK